MIILKTFNRKLFILLGCLNSNQQAEFNGQSNCNQHYNKNSTLFYEDIESTTVYADLAT